MVRGERAQLLLISSVLIALVIVASAMFINGLIVPETAESRTISSDAEYVSDDDHQLRSDLEELFYRTGRGDYGYAGVSSLENNVTAYNRRSFNLSGNARGGLGTISLNTSKSTRGAVLLQMVPGVMNWTDPGGYDWTMATDIRNLYTFSLNVSDPGGTGAIVLNETGAGPAGPTWRLEISDSDVVVNDDGDTTQLCSGTSIDAVYVEGRLLPDRTATVSVGGSATCPQREFQFGSPAIPQPWNLSVEQGNFLQNTTYAIAIDGNRVLGNYGGPPNWPTVESNQIVNPVFERRYVTDGVTYNSTFALLNRSAP